MKFTESPVSRRNATDLDVAASVELIIDKDTALFRDETKQQDLTEFPALAAT